MTRDRTTMTTGACGVSSRPPCGLFQREETLHWMHTQNNRVQFPARCICVYRFKNSISDRPCWFAAYMHNRFCCGKLVRRISRLLPVLFVAYAERVQSLFPTICRTSAVV